MRKEKWWLYLLMPVLVLFGIFSQSPSVKAVEVGDVITRMYVTDANGTPLTGDISQRQTFRLNADFVLPDNTVNTGDTTTITLPSDIDFAVSSAFQLKVPDGNVVANATIDGDRKTITLTYTNYAESHSNVTGNFFFYVRVDHNVVQSEQDINITLDIEGESVYAGQVHCNGPPGQYDSKLEKAGWQDNVDSQKLGYGLFNVQSFYRLKVHYFFYCLKY